MKTGFALSESFHNKIDHYPDIIKFHLTTLFNEIIKLSTENLYSIVLIGSTARNELSYFFLDEKIDIHGDYEFILVFKIKPKQCELLKLKNLFNRLEEEWNIKSPLFSIDYGAYSINRLKLLPKTLWLFELLKFGILVYGNKIDEFLPKSISYKNIDKGNLKHLILVRLWNTYKYLNTNYINNVNTDYELRVIKHIYARNVLDVLTVLLPHKNILHAGYGKRNEIFQNLEINCEWNNLKKEINACYLLKVDINNLDMNLDYSKTFINSFELLINEIFNIDFKKNKSKLTSKQPFDESLYQKLRWKLLDFKYLWHLRQFNLRSFSLIRKDRIRKNLILVLLLIHKSIVAKNKKEKLSHIKEAYKYVNKIDNQFKYDKIMKFDESFFLLRKKLNKIFIKHFYGLSNLKISDLNGINNWSRK